MSAYLSVKSNGSNTEGEERCRLSLSQNASDRKWRLFAAFISPPPFQQRLTSLSECRRYLDANAHAQDPNSESGVVLSASLPESPFWNFSALNLTWSGEPSSHKFQNADSGNDALSAMPLSPFFHLCHPSIINNRLSFSWKKRGINKFIMIYKWNWGKYYPYILIVN